MKQLKRFSLKVGSFNLFRLGCFLGCIFYLIFLDKQKMNRQAERKKRVFEMPNDPGIHLVKQKKLKTVSAASSSAMAFLEQMRGRHARVSKEERKRNFEKIKFNKSKQKLKY